MSDDFKNFDEENNDNEFFNNDESSNDNLDNVFDDDMIFFDDSSDEEDNYLSYEEVIRELKLSLTLSSEARIELLHHELPKKTPYSSGQLAKLLFQVINDEVDIRVEDIKNAKNRIERAVLKEELLKWLLPFVGKNEAETIVKERLVSISEQPSFHKVKDLFDEKDKNKSSYIVKGLIPLGSLLLWVAPPKIGKSLMATQFAMGVAYNMLLSDSRLFLGRQCESGKVLVIQNEENIFSTTASRIYTHGLQNLERDNAEKFQQLIESDNLIIAKGLDLIEDKEEILTYILERNIQLVVVDSLSASIRKSGLTEYHPETAQAILTWQTKCHAHNFTIILIHHATKADDNTDKFSSLKGVAGNNSLLRFNDGIWKFFQTPKRENSITIQTIPRQETPVNIVLEFERGEAGYWSFNVVEDNTLNHNDLELQNMIVKLLLEQWSIWLELNDANSPVLGLTLRELTYKTNQPKDRIVQLLNMMLDVEAIQFYVDSKRKCHVYHIESSGDCWLTHYFTYADTALLEDKKEILHLAVKSPAKVKAKILSLDKTNLNILWKNLNTEEKTMVMICIKPPMLAVGAKFGNKQVVKEIHYYDNSGYQYVLEDENGNLLNIDEKQLGNALPETPSEDSSQGED